jgi:DNA-nicking Smr family endonuclease
MKRRLTDADRRLFVEAMRDAAPVKRRAKVAPADKPPPPAPAAAAPPPAPPTPGPAAPPRPRAAPGANPGLDRRTEQRLRRGELAIDRRIDLHGLTQAEAHVALDRFVRGAAADGCRMLLIITGKGSGGEATLRRLVPRWLGQGAHAARVLRATPARPQHGGDGALYVLLRRRRERA